MVENSWTLPPEAEIPRIIFRKSLPLQLRLHETIRSMDELGGETCLDIGASNGMMSHHLRRRGGVWHSLALSRGAAQSLRDVVKENVYVLDGAALPFEKQVFDLAVILGDLERIVEDDAFIEEVHRVLKPDAQLVVNVVNQKTWSLLYPMRRMLGVVPERMGRARAGYTESDLFRILKHGFDVVNVRSYSRFFMEFSDVVGQFFLRRVGDGPEAARRSLRIYGLLGPLYWLSFQLDILLFFTRGNCLIAQAKRRAWRPRNAPVLVDGRSISEAVLSCPAD